MSIKLSKYSVEDLQEEIKVREMQLKKHAHIEKQLTKSIVELSKKAKMVSELTDRMLELKTTKDCKMIRSKMAKINKALFDIMNKQVE
jgi:hypothetical protein